MRHTDKTGNSPVNLALAKKMEESGCRHLLQQAFLTPSLMPALSHLLLLETVNKRRLCSNPDKLRGPHGRPGKLREQM